ncbi:threonine-phosphate decarboxylase CobD [Motilimonas sp. KMU-193]|uniref:threonine-phosphate decarboxylase CobD n=1 Tax=Motilimonas sp. KMU-193 TaxID=3388668 RepID=UPI00396B05AC
MSELHGGNVHRLIRQYGEQGWLDFSANINPLGLPSSVRRALTEQLDCLVQYPDPDYVQLRHSLAEYCQQPSHNIIQGNGATELIYLYFKALSPSKVLIIGPTFAEYQRAGEAIGAKVDYCLLHEQCQFSLCLEQVSAQLANKHYDVLVVCNPNNPTGQFIDLEQMAQLATLTQNHDCRMLVDEAFIEFVDNGEACSVARLGLPHVFVIRALTKFFALPGIRLGFAICHELALIERIAQIREPWSVNALAEVAAVTAVEDSEYIEASLQWLNAERAFLMAELAQLPGWVAYPSRVNFVLCKLPPIWQATALREVLLNQGIVIRNASNFHGLDESYIRLAIKSRSDNQRLITTLRQLSFYDA